ncbi:pantoate--beta-alanine ligase [Paraphotobacterium marinum]|uniref:Pantothenate synthetase n=1 Tax=Paraphotobacterium marinum TaxID=1755811 RepID=A0A220VD57_9GAMM|nr:pantoate--beta-alanine ligase [Paraphotobacterium marinum]ASK77903.1 pantoate--beta-alanine ligase [Paraphotobacterium marinum]
MQIVTTKNEVIKLSHKISLANQVIGFVPTMGNLHEGHLSLIREIKRHSDWVICSIFINPTQFNSQKDFETYPQTHQQDIELLKKENIDAIFMPSATEMYGKNLKLNTKIHVSPLANLLEGELRPGHFDGVATIVNKLFNIIKPNVSIFGEKDYQQLLIIKKMVTELDLPVQILSLPTKRNTNGLALSSRNNKLSITSLKKAENIFKVLNYLKTEIVSYNKKDYIALKFEAKELLRKHDIVLEELYFRDAGNLEEISIETNNVVILISCFLENVRLIDNIIFEI